MSSIDQRKEKLKAWKEQVAVKKAEQQAKQKADSVHLQQWKLGAPTSAADNVGIPPLRVPQQQQQQQEARSSAGHRQQPEKKNALRARPSNWQNIGQQQQQQQHHQLTKKSKIQLVVVNPNDENDQPAATVTGAADITMLLPRAKDLGSDFSNEDKTCFLSSLLADLAVASPKPAVGASGSNKSRAAASSSLSSASSSAFSLPAVHDTTTKITAAVEPSPALDGVAALEGSGAAAAGEPTASTAIQVRGVDYFRQQVIEQTRELTGLCERWATAVRSSAVPEDAAGDVHAATGQAQLLMSKRFTQFSGLCDMNESNQCFQPGQTARDADLDGFWDVIMMQVEDVKRTFEKLEEKAALGWKEPEAKDCRAPKKRKRAKDVTLERLRKQPKPGPVTPRRRAAKNRLAAAKRRMRPPASRLAGGGAAAATSTTVLTPMRASKRDQALLGTQFLLTPVRRSTRKTPSKYKQDPAAGKADVANLLVQSEYSYKPNFALTGSGVDGAAPAEQEAAAEMQSIDEVEEASDFGDDASEDGAAALEGLSSGSSSNGSSVTLAKYLFGTGIEDAVEPRTPGGIQQAPARRSRKMMAARGMATPVGARGGKVAVGTPTAGAPAPPQPVLGGVVRFAAITPGKGMREQLGTDAIYTPVRRSSRLVNTPGANRQHTVNKMSDLPSDLEYGSLPNKAFLN